MYAYSGRHHRFFGLLTACTVVIVGSGIAAAEPLADKSRETTTDDGWPLRITKTDETLDRYPNLAATMAVCCTCSSPPEAAPDDWWQFAITASYTGAEAVVRGRPGRGEGVVMDADRPQSSGFSGGGA